ncbi:MAG: hypothetical protein KDC92_15310, partial [Bacteroidetes bacterium]|nr:hypothetical protein [Bacteroidota bacterium]
MPIELNKRIHLPHSPKAILVSEWPTMHFWANPKKHSFEILDAQGEKAGILHLPVTYGSLTEDMKVADFLGTIPDFTENNLLVLMQAGEAVLGMVQNREMVAQKRIRKYMVRKKQGKAQITHLNQKGKSRAGSRIRLKQ